MSDRELLLFAAKAIDLAPVLCYESARNCLRIGDRKTMRLWRPLTDDGDALRLAVKLGLGIWQGVSNEEVVVEDYFSGRTTNEFHGFDAAEATRRAIVRAAAAIAQRGGESGNGEG